MLILSTLFLLRMRMIVVTIESNVMPPKMPMIIVVHLLCFFSANKVETKGREIDIRSDC